MTRVFAGNFARERFHFFRQNWIRNNRQDSIRGGVHSVPRELCLALLLVLCSLWALARLAFFSCTGHAVGLAVPVFTTAFGSIVSNSASSTSCIV